MFVSEHKLYVNRFDNLTSESRQEMEQWCCMNLYHGGYYEPLWWVEGNTFYFKSEQEYSWFMLKWS